MRTFGTFLAVGILALAAGCGGSSSTGIDGGGGAAGGGGGGAGGAGGGGGGSAGACNYPSCLASIATTCEPSGTCVDQTDATTLATNTCYSNGVKELLTFNLATGAVTVTYKNGSTTCYSIVAAGATTGTSYTLTVKNAAGATIATGTSDGTTTTVTCTGGAPVTLNSSCSAASAGTSTSNCTTGTCTP
jgi:hypothetical protein